MEARLIGMHSARWIAQPIREGSAFGDSLRTTMKQSFLVPDSEEAPWLKTTLVQCAWAAARSRGTYLQAQYVRIRARRGNQKAICAVAASILTTAYHMLKDGTFYENPGPDYFDKRNKEQQANKLVNRLQNLGFNVTIQPVAA
jgi:hypothetical protein